MKKKDTSDLLSIYSRPQPKYFESSLYCCCYKVMSIIMKQVTKKKGYLLRLFEYAKSGIPSIVR